MSCLSSTICLRNIYYLLAIVDISIIMCQSHKLWDLQNSLMSHMRYAIHSFSCYYFCYLVMLSSEPSSAYIVIPIVLFSTFRFIQVLILLPKANVSQMGHDHIFPFAFLYFTKESLLLCIYMLWACHCCCSVDQMI